MDPRPGSRIQHVEEPVVANGHGVGHLRGVQEMAGIPVAEGADGFQVVDRRRSEALFSGQAPGEGQTVDALQAFAARLDQCRRALVPERRRDAVLLSLGQNVIGIALHHRVAQQVASKPFQAVIGQEQAGMVGSQGCEHRDSFQESRREARAGAASHKS